jgi:hypothetical protein
MNYDSFLKNKNVLVILTCFTIIAGCGTHQLCGTLFCDSNSPASAVENTLVILENDKQSKIKPAWVTFKYGQREGYLAAVSQGVTIDKKQDDLEDLPLELGMIETINKLMEDNPPSAGIKQNSVKPKSQPIYNKKALNKQSVIELEWSIETGRDLKNPENCQLETPTFQLEGHDYSAQVWFIVIDNKLMVSTTTNIDITLEGVGLKMSNGTLESFTGSLDATSAYWSGNLSKVIKNNPLMGLVISGDELDGYKYEAVINLDGLKNKYKTYLACNR